jgi:hypothetical protein
LSKIRRAAFSRRLFEPMRCLLAPLDPSYTSAFQINVLIAFHRVKRRNRPDCVPSKREHDYENSSATGSPGLGPVLFFELDLEHDGVRVKDRFCASAVVAS